MVRERSLRGVEVMVQSRRGRSEPNPEMVCDELSLNELGRLSWASWPEAWPTLQEHNGEYLRPNDTVMVTVAEAIVCSYSSSFADKSYG